MRGVPIRDSFDCSPIKNENAVRFAGDGLQRVRTVITPYPMMRYFKFHWSESRGDGYDDWGTSWWYFEVADDGYVERQLEQYANGSCLTYDRDHIEDQFGRLAETPIEHEDLKELQPLSAAEFEAVWSTARPLNRKSG